MHAMFGSDIDSQVRVTLMVRKTVNDPFEPKEFSLSEAIEATFEQVSDTIAVRLPNPVWHVLYNATGKCHSFTKTEKINDENCKKIRDIVRDYIRKRVSGECKSDVEGNSDVLSLMLESPDVFSEDDVIDELLDFLVAGT